MDYASQIQSTAQEFLAHLGFPNSVTVDLHYDQPNNSYLLQLQTPDPAMLIGFHGETLSAIQLLLNHHLHLQFDQWFNLSLNVNDYRQRRQSSLNSLADSAVSKVIATGQPHALPPLPAGERRLVHMYLSDHPQVTTSSQGEGRHRTVIVSPKA